MVTLGSDYESTHLHLLDYPDFSPTGERPYNNRYSPIVEDSTPAERDNFAVMRMVLELLGMDWDTSREGDNQALRDAIDLEKRSGSGYLSLERFNDALEVAFQSKPTIETINVPIRGSATFDILPDNEKFTSLSDLTRIPQPKRSKSFSPELVVSSWRASTQKQRYSQELSDRIRSRESAYSLSEMPTTI